MKLLIDNEFKKWLMPLRQEEYDLLEQSILNEGCRESLVVWGDILVDGHNRYHICSIHGVPFTTTSIEFSSREEALDWIIRNQMSRRNVTPEQRDYLMGKLYKENKKCHGENRYTLKSTQNEDSTKTSTKIADQFKVGRATVERAERFTDAVDKIASTCGDSIKKHILTRDIPITKKDVITISSMPEHQQRDAIARIRSGTSSKRVLEESLSSQEHHEPKQLDLSNLVSIPCANPFCHNRVVMKESQYKDMVGVYPRKYGHVSTVHCSKKCAEGHALWIKAGLGDKVACNC